MTHNDKYEFIINIAKETDKIFSRSGDSYMLKKCQVFTPDDIALKMLNIAGYNKDLFGKKVLENSCGNGSILTQIIFQYIINCKENNIPKEQIKTGLENDIIAVEIDKDQAIKCEIKLNKIADSLNIQDVKWDIRIEDALKINFPRKFDFIIGNPPYINHRDMDIETRKFLKKTFSTCMSGKVDYCYAFIQKSIDLLSDNGILVYLIPNCIFKNVYANELRDIIRPIISDIYDYTTKALFEAKLTSSAIMKLQKGFTFNYLHYHDIVNDSIEIINKENLVNKWNFSDYLNNNQPLIFGEYFHASCSIATLCDKAFLLDIINNDEKYFYLSSGEKIEKAIVKSATSPRLKVHAQNKHIIFPYKHLNGVLSKISEQELVTDFPNAYKYLLTKKIELENTDKDQSAAWFEYGRSQGLQHLNQKKIMLSSIITQQVNAYLLSEDEIPFSGIIITQTAELALTDAIKILSTKNFLAYVESIGVNTKNSSRRISPKDINNYRFNI